MDTKTHFVLSLYAFCSKCSSFLLQGYEKYPTQEEEGCCEEGAESVSLPVETPIETKVLFIDAVFICAEEDDGKAMRKKLSRFHLCAMYAPFEGFSAGIG